MCDTKLLAQSTTITRRELEGLDWKTHGLAQKPRLWTGGVPDTRSDCVQREKQQHHYPGPSLQHTSMSIEASHAWPFDAEHGVRHVQQLAPVPSHRWREHRA